VRDQGEDVEGRFQAKIDDTHGSVQRMTELAPVKMVLAQLRVSNAQ
jgi:hypothetical protein